MSSWDFDFEWPSPPLSLNQRMHRHPHAQKVAELRALAKELAEEAGIPTMQRCKVTLTWLVGDRRHRDDENPVPTLKALCDGLTDAGIVPYDTNKYMVKMMPVIDYEKGRKPHSMRLTVTDIGEEA